MGFFLYLKGVYISETAHPDLRPNLAVLQSLFSAVGMLLIYGVGYFVEWRTLAWLCNIAPTLLVLTMLFLPESPYWLVEKDRKTEAE